MDLLPFGKLPPYQPRQFVPTEADLGRWESICPLFDRLESASGEITTVAELERWLLDWSEVTSAIDEEGARRNIAMTCNTDNAEAERAYLDFVEQIEPQTKPRQFKLAQIYAGHPLRRQLPRARYAVLDRDIELHVELFRPENVSLETEEAKLGQKYQKLTGSLTVNFRGEDKTLIQMGRYQEETDRALRQETWELVANRRLQEAERFEAIFEEQLKLRFEIARNAGFENYQTYAFRKLGRFDYTPADCHRFHEAVEQEIVPILRELHAERRQKLGIAALRPWDTAVDVLGRRPLRPFEKVERMVEGAQEIFQRLDSELAEGFAEMRRLKLLDLDNRKGKAPGGYQSTLAEARLPFIFMNAVGVQRDVETILHEAGHAFHALASRGEPIYSYRNAPIEFCEVASMSMELLGNDYLECFYAKAEADRARRSHLEGIMTILCWIATVDAFQHWIYTHPTHTAAEREQAWVGQMTRFGGLVDWTGYERTRGRLWHRQLHIFLYPFYYIEYGIAQLGALKVWANSRHDRAEALGAYKRALALGGSRPLPELFQAAGCEFRFDRETIKPLAAMIGQELQRLPN